MNLGIRYYLAHLMAVLCYSQTFISDTKNHELFCFRTNSALGRTECTFLRKLAQIDLFLFYWTIWTEEQNVTECSISSESEVIKNYLSFCRDWNSRDVSQTQAVRLNLTLLIKPGSPCEFRPSGFHHLLLINRQLTMDSQVGLGTKMRQKRAWTLPGTLWCGRGSSAVEYEQLGMFEQADRCCREHDHCNHVIRPFTVNFGMFNPTLFTISHCDCDNRFKQCLLDVNDTISNMVGYTFFNVLKIYCFNLIQKRRCTQINWLGMCTSVQIAPFAVLKDPTTYNATNLNFGISASPGYLERYTSYSKQKSAKSKNRKQSKAKTIYATVGVDNFPSRENPKQSYSRTKALPPRSTTTQPKWLKMRTSTMFQLKNQTNIQQKKLKNQVSLWPAAANITQRHRISLVTPSKKTLLKTMTSQKHIKTVNTTYTGKFKTLMSKQNCTSKESLREDTFWPKQKRRSICRMYSASNQKQSPLASKLRRRNKFSSRSKSSNIVSSRSYTFKISTPATLSNVTKLPKNRNANPSNSKKLERNLKL